MEKNILKFTSIVRYKHVFSIFTSIFICDFHLLILSFHYYKILRNYPIHFFYYGFHIYEFFTNGIWPYLIWFDLTLPDLIWPDLTWSDRSELVWPDLKESLFLMTSFLYSTHKYKPIQQQLFYIIIFFNLNTHHNYTIIIYEIVACMRIKHIICN